MGKLCLLILIVDFLTLFWKFLDFQSIITNLATTEISNVRIGEQGKLKSDKSDVEWTITQKMADQGCLTFIQLLSWPFAGLNYNRC